MLHLLEQYMRKMQAGFRIDEPDYDEIKRIADVENRSIGQMIHLMVLEQLKRYKSGGIAAITYKEQQA